jgi:hypothetical protein
VRRGTALLAAGAAGALAFALVFPALVVDDSLSYLAPARAWAAGAGLQEGGTPLESRLPAYPLVLGALIRAGGEHQRLFGLANATFLVAGMLAVAFLLRRRGPDLVGAVCGLAMVYPPFLTSTGMVLQESFIALLLALMLVLGWRAMETGSVALSFATGAALGAAGLAKVIALPLIVPLAVLLAVTVDRDRARRVAALVVGTLLVVTPWVVRNAVVLGRPELTNNNGGLTMLGGTVSNEISNWSHFPEYLAARERWQAEGGGTASSLDRALYRVAAQRIEADPLRWLSLVAERVLRFMLPARHWFVQTGRSAPATLGPWYLAAIAVQAALFASALLVVARTFRCRGPWTHLLPPLVVFHHLAVYALSYASPRYNVTVAPALVACLILAATDEPEPQPKGGA